MKKLLLLITLLIALPAGMLAQGNSWQEATLINDGETVKGYMDKDHEDAWYKIELPGDGRVTFVAQSDEELVIRYISINTINEDGTNFNEHDWIYLYTEEKPFVVNDLRAGTYYIRLHRETRGGNYTMKYTFTPCSYANDPEPNDEWTQASPLENGQTVQGHLGYWRFHSSTTDMDDWYKIVVPDDGSVTFDVRSEQSLVIRYIGLYPVNADGADVYERDYQYLNSEEKPYTVIDVAPGTYYVRLHFESGHRYYGGYTMKYTFTPDRYRGDAEPNNDYEHAIEIKNGETITGHLGYLYNKGSVDDDDWYKMKITGGLAVFQIQADTTTRLDVRYIELFLLKDGNLKSKGWVYVHREPGELIVNDLEEGTYYLRVHRESGEGGYSLTCGAYERPLDSKIRVHYIGPKMIREGVPTAFQVKVENIDSNPTGSFFLVVPVSDDVKLLYAECPCDTGIVRYSIEDMSDEAQNCAALYVPNLDPFESYTLTMYAEGRVDGKEVRSNRIAITGTFLAVGAFVGSVAVGLIVDRGIRYYQDKYHDYVVKEGIEDKYMRSLSLTKDQLLDQKEEYNLPVECVKGVTKKIGENVMKTVPGGGTVATFMGNVENVKGVSSDARRHAVTLWGRQGAIDDISDYMEGRGEYADFKVGATKTGKSLDPNEMCGPAGYGDEGFISETRTMDYIIRFENKKEATAPAYRIRITDILDESVFDVNTVRFGSSSHEGLQYNWKISREGNKLFWDIEGIELPPNVNAPEGEGFVTFSVDLKPGLKSGTQIKNKATIIFDYNEPIETNEYLNTLDLNAPTGRVQAVTVNDNKITINCTGEDSESGIGYYKYYYSLNGGDFQILTESSSPEMTFPMEEGRSASDYTFCVVAIDNVGNSQLTLSEPYAVGTSISNREVGPCNDTWTITRLDGQVVASGKGTPSARLATGGVYIIRQGNTARKVILK